MNLQLLISNKLSTVERKGINSLVEWLNSTTFFTDPASANNHLNYEGGLANHSWNVYTNLLNISRNTLDLQKLTGKSVQRLNESIIVCGLLHDVCKIGCYQPTVKNVKHYVSPLYENDMWKLNDTGEEVQIQNSSIKHDRLGYFIWQAENGYKFSDPFPYGHGEKSVLLISHHISLTDDEEMAIRYHMGAFIESDKPNISTVYSKYPLAWCLHIADEMATYITENE